MATKSTWIVDAVHGATSSIYFWKITNLLTGKIKYFPVSVFELNLVNPSNSSASTDYNFVFISSDLKEFSINVLDIKYIGSGTSAPAYNAPATDLASILALI